MMENDVLFHFNRSEVTRRERVCLLAYSQIAPNVHNSFTAIDVYPVIWFCSNVASYY